MSPLPLVGYVVVSGDVQIGNLYWELDNPASFTTTFKTFMEGSFDEIYNEYDLVALAIDLFSLKYTVLDLSQFEMKFIRMLFIEQCLEP